MHPDYGMALTKKGAREDQDMEFLDVALDHITMLSGDTFTTVVIITQKEFKFAASFDFAMPFMSDLARLAPPRVKGMLLESVNAMDKFPWPIDFNQPVRVWIKAHLGPIKKSEDEEFRPFIVEALKKPCPTP